MGWGQVEGKEQQWLVIGELLIQDHGALPGWTEKPVTSILPPAPPRSLVLSIKAANPAAGGSRGAALIKLTVTLEALPRQAPEQGPTVLTEGGALVIVDLKSVWHVDFEPLLVELKGKKNA